MRIDTDYFKLHVEMNHIKLHKLIWNLISSLSSKVKI